MSTGISFTLKEADRRRLEALVADLRHATEAVRRDQIVLMSADGVGTTAIMAAATDTAKTTA